MDVPIECDTVLGNATGLFSASTTLCSILIPSSSGTETILCFVISGLCDDVGADSVLVGGGSDSAAGAV